VSKDPDYEQEHRALVVLAQACWHPTEPAHWFHVFDWMADRLQRKYPEAWGPSPNANGKSNDGAA
jgi:hypothetical protein